MIIPAAKDYSIWLMFKKDEELTLQLIIEKLSKDFNSPSFKPHITLIHGFKDEEEILIKKFSSFSENLSEFRVKVRGINYSDDFYKSLYLEIKKSELLDNLYKKAANFFELSSQESEFLPHISLLYSHIPLQKKQELVKELSKISFESFRVDKISLVKTSGIPFEWEEKLTVLL